MPATVMSRVPAKVLVGAMKLTSRFFRPKGRGPEIHVRGVGVAKDGAKIVGRPRRQDAGDRSGLLDDVAEQRLVGNDGHAAC